MGKTKAEKKADKKKSKRLAEAKDDLFQAHGLIPPPSRPLDEDSALRPLKEDHALRSSGEESLRLSGSSEEAVIDTMLPAPGKEQAPASTVSSSSKVDDDNRVMSVTVMPAGGMEHYPLPVKHLMGIAMKFMKPDRPAEQKAVDIAKPAQAEKEEDANVEVNYEGDSQDDEIEELALRNG